MQDNPLARYARYPVILSISKRYGIAIKFRTNGGINDG
jgi:hypothetical protein